MNLSFSPLMLVTACIMGAVSAYIAFKRQKNPYLWFFLGFLFGIFGIFAIFLTGSKKKASFKNQEPSFKIDGPNDKFWYYLDPSHNQQGPISKEGLTTAWRSGKIDLSTFVWNEEFSDWKPLKETLVKDA